MGPQFLGTGSAHLQAWPVAWSCAPPEPTSCSARMDSATLALPAACPAPAVHADAAATTPAVTFVLGAARSGTTWLAKLFDSSPNVLYIHEPLTKGHSLKYHQRVREALAGTIASNPAANRAIASEFLALHESFARPPFFKKAYQDTAPYWAAAHWYLRRLLGSERRLPANPIRPDANLQVLIKDGLSSIALPVAASMNARTIVLLRHPCGVVNSRLRGVQCGAMKSIDRSTFFAENEAACLALGYDRSAVASMQEDELLALDWLIVNQPVADLYQRADDSVRWITFRALVDRPQEVLAELFAWCGIAMTEQTRGYIERSSQLSLDPLRSILGQQALYYAVSRRDAEPHYVWQRELSRSSIDRILRIVDRFPLAAYGLD